MVISRYQCEERVFPTSERHVHYIDVKQEVLDARFDSLGPNSATSSEVTVPITIYAVSNRDKLGLHARGILVAWEGSAPAGYKTKGRVWIPVLLANKWNRLMLHSGGEYLGSRFIIVGKRGETLRS